MVTWAGIPDLLEGSNIRLVRAMTGETEGTATIRALSTFASTCRIVKG